ncbi:MAG: hypothetical protein H6825_07465 [Planctomycetes bacterium]|nr:hypothetical protein [Planctomycetota bacterium]
MAILAGVLVALAGVVATIQPGEQQETHEVPVAKALSRPDADVRMDLGAGIAPEVAETEAPACEPLRSPVLLADGARIADAGLGSRDIDRGDGLGALDDGQMGKLNKIGKRAKSIQKRCEKADGKVVAAQDAVAAAQAALEAALALPASTVKELAIKAKAVKSATHQLAKAEAKLEKRVASVDKLHDRLSDLHALVADIDQQFFASFDGSVPNLAVMNLEEQDLLFYWTPVDGASGYSLTWTQHPGVTAGVGNVIDVDDDLYVLTGLADEQQVYAVLTATFGTDVSDQSNEVEAITGPLTQGQIEKLGRLQKQLDKKEAKQATIEEKISESEAALLDAQAELAAAQALPETTNEEQDAKAAAIAAAEAKIAKAEKAIQKWTKRLDINQSAIDGLVSKIEDIDPDYFETITFIPSPEMLAPVGGDGYVSFDWTDVEGAEGYTLYISSQPDVTPETGAPFACAVSQFSLEDLPADFTVYGVATATVDGEETPPSNEESATTDPTVEPDPVLSIDPLSISFIAVEGGADPASRTVTVSNEGGGLLDWTATPSAAWITASSTSGSLGASQSDTLSVSVHVTGLPAGTYHEMLTFASPEAANPSESLAIMLVVSEPPPVIAVSPGSLSFNATEGGGDPSSQVVSIMNDGGGTLSWSATDNKSWLSVSPTSGSLAAGQSKNVTVSVSTTGAGVGGHTGAITFSAPSIDSVNVPVSFTVTQASSSSVTASIAPTRTSGVAPLSVLFDGSGSTAEGVARPFHELEYSWNYGDVGSGTWGTDGMSRNSDRSPIAGHVFETPGTYTVTLDVTDADGNAGQDQVAITVLDPDVVYAGTKTICISRTGDFSGAPAGAQQVTTTSYDTAMGYVHTGKRVLFRRGESWTGGGANKNEPGPVTIGAYGTGARPKFTMSDHFIRLSDGPGPDCDDWRIMDLDLTGSGSVSITLEGSVHDLLCLRLNVHDALQGYAAVIQVLDYWNNNGYPQTLHRGLAIVDSNFKDQAERHVTFDGTYSMMLGNTLDHITVDGHIVRSQASSNSVYCHNDFKNAKFDRHLLKLHAQNWNKAGFGYHKYTEKIVIADNLFDAGASNWPVVPGPQNDQEDERLRDILIERNLFRAGDTTTILLRASGSDVTTRHNIFDLTSGGEVGVWVSKRGSDPNPQNHQVLNNTFYRGDSGGFEAVHVAGDAVGTIVRNNLGSAPSASSPDTIIQNDAGGSTTYDHNLLTNDPLFVVSNPHEPMDFALKANSPAVDKGIEMDATLGDFETAAIPTDGDSSGSAEPDIGAFEYKP